MEIIISEDIASAATVIDSEIDSLLNDIKEMEGRIASLYNVWDGQDAASFQNRYMHEIIDTYREHVKTLYECTSYMRQVPEVFKALDLSYDRSIDF